MEWIRVEDRLPDGVPSVLAWPLKHESGRDYIVMGWHHPATGWRETEWGTDGYRELPDVTHWMPLPQPPQDVPLEVE